jgi:hypothetical protein
MMRLWTVGLLGLFLAVGGCNKRLDPKPEDKCSAASTASAESKTTTKKDDDKKADKKDDDKKSDKTAKKGDDDDKKHEKADEDVGFFASYARSQDPQGNQFRDAFKKEKILEKMADELNKVVIMKKKVEMQMRDCGEANAFYSRTKQELVMCYELLTYFMNLFKPTVKSEEELGKAVVGATFFTFFHELGHALVHVLDLPVTGKEEDAVDQLSVLVLLESGDEGLDAILSGANWFLIQGSKTGKLSKLHFADEHSLDQQRFYNIACLVFGSAPGKHVSLVSRGFLPENRAVRCENEFKQIEGAWKKILGPHLRGGWKTINEGKDHK